MTQILIRAPVELKEKLKQEASKKGITLNAMILTLIWKWTDNKK